MRRRGGARITSRCAGTRSFSKAVRRGNISRGSQRWRGSAGGNGVTFKLMDYQEPAAWAWLARHPRVPVIHLRRADALAAAASALAGEQSGLWHARSAEDVARAAEVRVALSRAQLAEWRVRQRALARRVRAWRRPVLALEYAELAADFSATLARVFAFLGLPPHAVAPTQEKLHVRPLAEWIENYAALR